MVFWTLNSCIVQLRFFASEGSMLLTRAIGFSLLLLALAACSRGSADMAPAPVRIAPDLMVTLPSPDDLDRTVEASQLLTASYGEQSFVFEARLSANRERFLMVGLDPMGRELLRVNWTRTGLDYTVAPWVPAGLRPEHMLADIVLLYWPEDAVRRALAPSGGTLVSGARSRLVTIGEKEVMRADYQPASGDDPWTGRLHYRNLAWGYELDIQSSEVRP